MAVRAAGPAAQDGVMNARLLAFDTSTELMAVALQSDAGLLTWNGAGGAAASSQLLPKIESLMRQAGLDFGDLQAIAFGKGPGAFTGLRTACAVAQGLALGTALPVLAVDSLLIVAEAARPEAVTGLAEGAALDMLVAMDARMGEIYAGRYAWDGQRWSVLAAAALCTTEALNAACLVHPPVCATGSAWAAFGTQLSPGKARLILQAQDRGGALMRLAQQAWIDGQAVDAALAVPVYLRDKVALTVGERQALRAAGGAG